MEEEQELRRPLEEIRHEIDALDQTLVRLLNQRASLAQEVGRTKSVANAPFFTPERERAIYERLAELNAGPLRTDQLVNVFREIISAARAAERPLQIGFWGPEGTFSHEAARQTFGTSSQLIGREGIPEVFEAVDRGELDYGVVPIENSVAGVIPVTLDMFGRTRVRVCAETYVPITHHLVSLAPDLQSVKVVLAGPQPSAQCRNWLRTNLPHAPILEISPTVRAVQMAAEDPTAAAIGNRLAAEIHQVPILAERIEDDPANRTRFLVIGFNEPARTGRDKTTLLFNLRNQPGALYHALGTFMTHGVNLLMIESRPSTAGDFEYMFFADAEGHRHDEPLKQALTALKQLSLDCIVLGSYPAAPEGR